MCAVAFLALVVSCRQVIGVADREPPLRCEAPPGVSAACGSCLATTCCFEADASADRAAALAACKAEKCADACGLTCGGAGSPIVGCQPCSSACCSDGAAFQSSLDGQLLLACRASCPAGDITCREACANLHAEGAHLERAADECITSACSIAADWSCVGRVDRTPPGTAPIALDVVVFDIETNQPLSGMTVKGCTADDLACSTAPFGTATTNASGAARVLIPSPATGGARSYGGFVEIARDDYVTGLLWFDPPLTESTTVGVVLPSKTLLSNLSATSGVVIDATRGIVGVGTRDCANGGAAGVSIAVSTADAATRVSYRRGNAAGGPSLDFSVTSTSDLATAIVFDVPPGPATVTARADALCLDYASTQLAVRANAVSIVFLGPLR
jgi:hypothetical protein